MRWNDPTVHNRGELSTCALIDGLHHLEPHRHALLARREKFKRAGQAATELAAAAGELLSFGVIGAGKSLIELAQLWREERHAQTNERLSVEQRQDDALRAQIDGLFEFLKSVVDPSPIDSDRLPVILVLDDAHWMDSRSLSLVERLVGAASRNAWPLMTIVTHWEQDWNLQVEDPTRDSFPSFYTRLADDPTHTNAALTLELRDIGRLQGLQRLLRESLPGLTDEQVAFLCDRADGNPRLMNEIILELRDEETYFEEEDTSRSLSESGLAALHDKSFALEDVQVGDSANSIAPCGSFLVMRATRVCGFCVS